MILCDTIKPSLNLFLAGLCLVSTSSLTLAHSAEEHSSDETVQVAIAIQSFKGYFAERCFALEAKATVTWAFEAPYPVDFNVHIHEGAETLYPEKMEAVKSANGVLPSGGHDEHCFMWTSTVDVEADWTIGFTYQVQGKGR